MDGEIMEAVLCIVSHISDLLHPGHEDLVLVSVIMSWRQSSAMLELVPDESVVALNAELQGHLLRESGFGIAKRSIQHGLAHAQRRSVPPLHL
jgi:hypothetical protein